MSVKKLHDFEKQKEYKAGDNLYSMPSSRKASRGSNYYQSEAFLKAQNAAYTAADGARKELSKMEVGWEQHTTIEDIEIMAKLEEALSKKMVNVSVSIDKRSHELHVIEALKNVELGNYALYPSSEEMLSKIKETHLLLSSYKYSIGDLDGRNINTKVQDFNFESEHIIHHCLVSGYDETQATNLRAIGLDVFSLIMKEESPDKVIEGLTSLIRGYYALHLVEVIFGRQRAVEVRSRQHKLKHSLETLEKLASKSKFKILVIDGNPESANKTLDFIYDLGYRNVTHVETIEDSIVSMEGEQFDLVISDYRLTDGNANKVFDYIEASKFSIRRKPEFVIISGYKEEEVLHLKKYGIRIYDKVDVNNIELIVKGCYVKKIRNLLDESL